MGAEDAIKIGVAVVIVVMIAGAMLAIYKQGNGFINKGLSQATDLSSKFNDIDKQKYDGMSCMGDSVVDVIRDYWEDPTCEIVVCTLDGVNAVYNKESTDGTYQVPFNEVLTGMPTADCKGRIFPTDITINNVPTGMELSTDQNPNTEKGTEKGTETDVPYDVSKISQANIDDKGTPGAAFIVDAAKVVQNSKVAASVLATKTGYNATLAVGSGGYISNTATFVGSVQKDINGAIRRITFVQNH